MGLGPNMFDVVFPSFFRRPFLNLSRIFVSLIAEETQTNSFHLARVRDFGDFLRRDEFRADLLQVLSGGKT